MPISDICHRTRHLCRQGPSPPPSDLSFRDNPSLRPCQETIGSTLRVRGFTLIELIVALVLLGLLSAVAIPNLQNLFGGVDRTVQRDRIVDQIAGLGRRAVLERSAWIVMDSTPTSKGRTSAFAEEGVSDDFAASEDDIHFGEIPGDRFVRYPLEIPASWEVKLDPPLLIRSNGVCLGSDLTLLHEGEQVMQLTLHPPYCELKQEDDPENSDSGSG